METTTANTTTAKPMTPPELPRALGRAVVVANVLTAGLAAVLVVAVRPADGWRALAAAVLIAAAGVIGSVAVLGRAAGKSVDWLVTFVMGASAVRMGVSVAGLMLAVAAFKTPAALTALGVVAFYVVTLVVETSILSRTLRRATPTGIAGGIDA